MDSAQWGKMINLIEKVGGKTIENRTEAATGAKKSVRRQECKWTKEKNNWRIARTDLPRQDEPIKL